MADTVRDGPTQTLQVPEFPEQYFQIKITEQDFQIKINGEIIFSNLESTLRCALKSYLKTKYQWTDKIF